MPTGDVLPLLLMLFGLVAIGHLLRAAGVVPPNAADVLARVLVRVTVPALIVVILADARFDPALLPALAAAALALLAALLLTLLLTRRLGLSRPAQGAAALTASFSNTAFLGLPFILALYPDTPAAATAAVLVDTFVTTILLLTLGVSVAAAMAHERRPAPAPLSRHLLALLRDLLRRPLVLAVLVGLALAASGLALPSPVAAPLRQIGGATPTLAFLTIGLGLDLQALRGRTRPLLLIAALKLLLTPALAALLLIALGVRGEAAQVAVLQSAMPTAVVSGIIAAEAGCDRGLASGAPVITTLLALLTLPLAIAAIRAGGL